MAVRYAQLATAVTGLSSLDYHVWAHMKNIVEKERKFDTRELFKWIFDAARRFNNATVPTATRSLIKRVRKCMKTDCDHFEQLLTA